MTNAWIDYTTFYYFLSTSLSTASFFSFVLFSWLTPGWPLPPDIPPRLLHDQCMDKLYHILLLLTNFLIHCFLRLFQVLLMADPWLTFAPWPSTPLLQDQCMDKLYHVLLLLTNFLIHCLLLLFCALLMADPWLTFAPWPSTSWQLTLEVVRNGPSCLEVNSEGQAIASKHFNESSAGSADWDVGEVAYRCDVCFYVYMEESEGKTEISAYINPSTAIITSFLKTSPCHKYDPHVFQDLVEVERKMLTEIFIVLQCF